jgi:hypothetical protein
MFNVIAEFRQGIFDIPNEVPATGRAAAEANNRIPLGMIVGDSQDLPIGAKTVNGPLDHLVGGLAFA